MNRLLDKDLLGLMELAARPDIISFAGGFPSVDVFPTKEMALVTELIMKESGNEALQYASTTGFLPLREKISERMNRLHTLSSTFDDIIITSGSQQTLDMLSMIFLDEGDIVLCESPTYLGAMNAFKAYTSHFIEVPTEEDGMDMEALRNILAFKGDKIKLIYVIPDFQNPTGTAWSIEKRKEFMAIMQDYQIPVIEDGAYYDLAYEETNRPSLVSMDTKEQVIYVGSFSKIFCPGLRVAWVYGPKNVIEAITVIKPNIDLSSSSISQRLVNKYMEMYDLEAHIKAACQVYKSRRDTMLSIIESDFPKSIQYTKPQGGFFTWIELPNNKNARELLELALEEGVAFVPGESFYPNSQVENVLRINFSNMSEDVIEVGAKKLAKIVTKFIDE
jgi:2-aminoadipate transaminase